MGADGGSIPDRRDLVRTKAKAGQTDKDLLRELFFLCALSKRPLTRPVVLDPLGKLYNKDAVLEFFIDRSKYGDGDLICGYLKGVKDLLTLNLTPNPAYSPTDSISTSQALARAPFVCPLSLREMTGSIPFLALRPCGCVFAEASIRAVMPTLSRGVAGKEEIPDEVKPLATNGDSAGGKEVACPNCGKTIDPTDRASVMPINPPREAQEALLDHLLVARAAAKADKAASKKRKAHAITVNPPTATDDVPPAAKTQRQHSASASPAPPSHRPTPPGSGRSTPVPQAGQTSVQRKLAEQEMKRIKAQEGMSDAVKAMFRPKNEESGKTGGAADFFGRTFTRYAA